MSLHNTDYFKNHDNVGKFPWNIYHQPLENELKDFLKKIESNNNSGDILVIGCGLMNEMSILPKTFNYTLADIDKRIVNYWLEKEDVNYKPGFYKQMQYFIKLIKNKKNTWPAISIENVYESVKTAKMISKF